MVGIRIIIAAIPVITAMGVTLTIMVTTKMVVTWETMVITMSAVTFVTTTSRIALGLTCIFRSSEHCAAAGKRTYSVHSFSQATNRISEGFSLVFAEDEKPQYQQDDRNSPSIS
jgi:hypothetical protein